MNDMDNDLHPSPMSEGQQALSRRFTPGPAKALRAEILGRLDALLAHKGHGDLCISVRWAKRGTREIIVSGGPQERFLLRESGSSQNDDQGG